MKSLKLSSNLKYSLSKLTINQPFYRIAVAQFSDKMKDKEVAEEKFYFDKEERRLAQDLLRKLKIDKKEEPLDDETYKLRERLRKVLETHHESFSDALVDDLVKWKKGH